MSDTSKISFRLSPVLQAALIARVRQQGTSASDILREALEAYLGLRPTDRPTETGLSSDVSDSVWGMVAGTARSWLARSPRRLEALGGAGGLTMIGVGVRLAATGRKD